MPLNCTAPDVGSMQPQHATADRRLARARLADQAERLAGADRTTRRTRPARRSSGRTPRRGPGSASRDRATSSIGASTARSGRRPRRLALTAGLPVAAELLGEVARRPAGPVAPICRNGGCSSRADRPRDRAPRVERAARRRIQHRSAANRRSAASGSPRLPAPAASRAAHACTDDRGSVEHVVDRRRARRLRPAYITCTRSATRAITPRSCVMNTTARRRALLHLS